MSGPSLLTDQPWLCGSRWIPVESRQVSRSLGQRKPWGRAHKYLYLMPKPGSSCLPRVASLLVQHARLGPHPDPGQWFSCLGWGLGEPWLECGEGRWKGGYFLCPHLGPESNPRVFVCMCICLYTCFCVPISMCISVCTCMCM